MIKRKIETVQFKLQENVEELNFVAEIEKTKPLISEIDGFVKRSIAKGENGTWIDVLEWESELEFKSLFQLVKQDSALEDYCKMINFDDAVTQRFTLETRFFSK